ncbi:MAG: cell division protein FtsZ [Bryobacter sp.]|nr:cell division protein FtsZ [Bryobacter sp.]
MNVFDQILQGGMKFELEEDFVPPTRIKVVGVGGGGGNAVARMMDAGLTGVEFFVLNTDKQALQASPVPNKLALGAKITNGLGAGADPEIGRKAALEDTERIIEIVQDAQMVFVTAGLGGGTGTGAAPIVASLAKEIGALTVAVVTKPFEFEGIRRQRAAERGLAEIAGAVDTVIPIPNQRLLNLAPKGTGFAAAFKLADEVLRQAVQGISDIITTPGLINRDFSDIKTIMTGMGYAMMGTATAKGENAAVEAARLAISSPLLEEGGVKGARGILINITGSSALGLHELNEACSLIRQASANDDVHINFGVVFNETMGEEVKITVIATGFERETLPHIERRVQAHQTMQAAPEPRPLAQAAAAGAFFTNAFTAMEEPKVVLDAFESAPSISPDEVFTPGPLTDGEVTFLPPHPAPLDAAPEAPPTFSNGAAPDDDFDTPAYIKRERKLFN